MERLIVISNEGRADEEGVEVDEGEAVEGNLEMLRIAYVLLENHPLLFPSALSTSFARFRAGLGTNAQIRRRQLESRNRFSPFVFFRNLEAGWSE